VDQQNVTNSMKLILEYGFSAPEMFEQLKAVIRRDIGKMTGLRVVELNVAVVDVKTRAEFEKQPAASAAPSRKADGEHSDYYYKGFDQY
jgi:uncharacterized alkaline shock family protein YloU